MEILDYIVVKTLNLQNTLNLKNNLNVICLFGLCQLHTINMAVP
jgi:hypothetical protein